MSAEKNTTTLRKAMGYVASATGISSEKEQMQIVNDIRAYLFSKQIDLQLDLCTPFCVKIDCFSKHCPTRCGKTFYGFRLPSQFLSITAAYIYDYPMSVQSHWRMPHDGIVKDEHQVRSRVIDRRFSPFQRDPSHDWDGRLTFAGSAYNSGQVILEGYDLEDRPLKKSYSMTETFTTSDAFSHIDSLHFSEPLKGDLQVRDCKGRELAVYHKCEESPSFRTFEYVGYIPCAKNGVVVYPVRRYEELFDLREIVEYDNPFVWKNLAIFTHLNSKLGADGNDRANESKHLGLALDMISSQQRVENNEATSTYIRRKRLKSGKLRNKHRY